MRKVKYSELQTGMKLRATISEFGCLAKNDICQVKFANPKDGFYVECRAGKHFLDIQISESDEIIGFELADDNTEINYKYTLG